MAKKPTQHKRPGSAVKGNESEKRITGHDSEGEFVEKQKLSVKDPAALIELIKQASSVTKNTTGLSDVLARKYNRNYLDKTIVRADFATPITLSFGLRKRLVRVLKDWFPVFEEGHLVEGEFSIGDSGTLEAKPTLGAKLWKLKGQGKSLAVSDNYCWVEYLKYESFDKLNEEFFSLLSVILKSEPELKAKRLGLRYVDKLDFSDEPKPTEWGKYLCPELLASFDLAEDRALISRVFNILEMNYGDGLQLRFQYGMMNPDHPAAIKRKVYTLDHDVYAMGLYEKRELKELLGKLRIKAKESFERIITDGLRAKMGVKK